jgi:hypothetical protein
MIEWRSDGSLGVLLTVINCIKTLQQYGVFTNIQKLAHYELPILSAPPNCSLQSTPTPITT